MPLFNAYQMARTWWLGDIGEIREEARAQLLGVF